MYQQKLRSPALFEEGLDLQWKIAVAGRGPAGVIVVETVEKINHRESSLRLFVVGGWGEDAVAGVLVQSTRSEASKLDSGASGELDVLRVFQAARGSIPLSMKHRVGSEAQGKYGKNSRDSHSHHCSP